MRFIGCLVGSIAVLCACPTKKPNIEPDPEPTRCEVKLEDTGFFASVGSGSKAKLIESSASLIGGGYAQGVVGDYLLSNDRIRVVIQRPTRAIAPAPYGGTIIDADLQRTTGSGRDTFGKLEVLYAFGRSINVHTVEVLNDGSKGGFAVIAATGDDAVIDYLNPPNVIETYLGSGLTLVANPNKPLTLMATTYYVLSPGESRVRVLTAFCNKGTETIVTSVGDIVDPGGESSTFNPLGCTNGLGTYNCLADPSTFFGVQSNGVAYGYRNYTFANPRTASTNALVSVAGIGAVIAEAKDKSGLLTWVDANAMSRPGAFGILAGQNRNYLRDFYVDRDLGAITGSILVNENTAKTRLTVSAKTFDGTPAPGARVAVMVAETGRQITLMVADDSGLAKADVAPGNYLVSTGTQGAALETPTPVEVSSTTAATATVKIGASRTITVNVKDPFNAGLTAKVVIVCPFGPCSSRPAAYTHLFEIEEWPSSIQTIAFASAQGLAIIQVPPGSYEVMVTRGPEYSAYPDTFPAHGVAVDVTTADATVNATLAHVVDTRGWISADLHVHAVNSPDSTVPNAVRVMSFAAEGVDVLVSTDHDFITDYAPIARELGVQDQIATMIGCEVTPFDYGHQQTYPVSRGSEFGGSPFDWGGGDGPSLRLDQLYVGLRARDPDVVIQMNHPRSAPGGSLEALKVNTLTGASAARPETFRMAAHPEATATDTKLFSSNFDAIEAMNGTAASYAVLNDWMTFTSRGWVKTATAGSDSHNTFIVTGGYGRSWIRSESDAIADFSSAKLATAVRARQVIGSSGPFITLTARKAGAATAASVGDTLSIAAGDTVELTVDVQAPEWMQFDAIELYSHAEGRESKDGVANAAWPESRVFKRKRLDPTALTLEPVPGLNGFTARRVHVVETFTITPTTDTWVMAMVNSGTASRPLYPLTWASVACMGGICTAVAARAQGFTNAILLDADGSGKYDNFPIR